VGENVNLRIGKDQKQQIFVREYVRDGNGTRAAIAAGYSQKAASVAASRLLRNAKVQQELAKLQKTLCERLEISAEKVLQGIAQLAFFDPRKFFNADGSLKSVVELDDTSAMALQAFDQEKLFKHFAKGQAEEVGTVSKIKLADRGLNLERLGRHLKLFTDKVEVANGEAILAALKAGRARVAAAKG